MDIGVLIKFLSASPVEHGAEIPVLLDPNGTQWIPQSLLGSGLQGAAFLFHSQTAQLIVGKVGPDEHALEREFNVVRTLQTSSTVPRLTPPFANSVYGNLDSDLCTYNTVLVTEYRNPGLFVCCCFVLFCFFHCRVLVEYGRCEFAS